VGNKDPLDLLETQDYRGLPEILGNKVFKGLKEIRETQDHRDCKDRKENQEARHVVITLNALRT